MFLFGLSRIHILSVSLALSLSFFLSLSHRLYQQQANRNRCQVISHDPVENFIGTIRRLDRWELYLFTHDSLSFRMHLFQHGRSAEWEGENIFNISTGNISKVLFKFMQLSCEVPISSKTFYYEMSYWLNPKKKGFVVRLCSSFYRCTATNNVFICSLFIIVCRDCTVCERPSLCTIKYSNRKRRHIKGVYIWDYIMRWFVF